MSIATQITLQQHAKNTRQRIENAVEQLPAMAKAYPGINEITKCSIELSVMVERLAEAVEKSEAASCQS